MKTRHPAITLLIGFLLGAGSLLWMGPFTGEVTPTVGRYQGVPAADGSCFVVDTMTGKVQRAP